MVSREDHFYYTQELRFLDKEGLRFAEKHPDIARQLGLEGVNAELRDPHSERILEGFAYLTGRIRKMLDRQYPELAHALFNLIFPSYLRPVPGKTICQFVTKEGMLDKPQIIPRETEISGMVNESKVTFTTAHDCLVQPLTLEKFYVDPETASDFSVSAKLRVHEGVDPMVLDLDQLEFFIHGDPGLRFELFRQLNHNLKDIQIKGLKIPSNQLEIDWSGFTDEHSFVDDEIGTYLPLHLIRDYFDHPERFMFFRIRGLSEALAPWIDELSEFQIDFHFRAPFATGTSVSNRNLLLFACSCQNVFRQAAEPLIVDGRQLEYRVIPDISEPEREVYAIEKLLLSKERQQHIVQPYYRFDNHSSKVGDHFFYSMRREPNDTGGWESFLRIFQLNQEGPVPLSGFTGSTQILATQGNLVRRVKIGQLDQLDRTIPETIQVHNVTQVSAPCWPRLYGDVDWAFISHLALNYNDIQRIEPLKELLKLYNFLQSETIQRKINGLKSLEKKRDYVIRSGRIINGIQLLLECEEDKFQHLGDVILFGQVLGQFLKAYCPFNSFIKLVLEIGHQEKLLECLVTG